MGNFLCTIQGSRGLSYRAFEIALANGNLDAHHLETNSLFVTELVHIDLVDTVHGFTEPSPPEQTAGKSERCHSMAHPFLQSARCRHGCRQYSLPLLHPPI